ncbi:transposase [Massilia sp. KIM]|uniref:Mu transposase C-terminal domain-containing protein n=1 Tax=Massilia sp. KIM TaxID=1955422 RepID=UPI00098F24D5|nr:Mu transposase C-terminal domain-containing protein [Massilia sp. KIM]OON62313.1 transposase [Massilia sp. KIM]
MIKDRYSAAELASLQLPNLPASKGKVIQFAEKAKWTYVEVCGRGGKRREYIPSPEIIDAIRAKEAQQFLAIAARAPAPIVPRKVGPADQLPLIETEGQALKADARKGVLLALDTLMNRSGYPMKKAARVLIEMARKGEAGEQMIAMLKMARDGRGRPSPDGLPSERSVLRFVEYERAGMLAPKKREADMSVPAWAKAFLAHYQRPEKPTVEHAYREFLQALGDKTAAPSIWQVRRFLAKVGNVSLQLGRMGDREIKSLKGFVRRDFANLLPGDIYSADGHTFDAEVQHPMHGRPFRPEITSVIDIATRRTVGWSVGLAESTFAVVDALRSAVFNGGIPAVFYVDNGSGYKNELMSDTGTGFLARLGIEMINSLPYNSQARGVIEKLHQTIWVNAAKELPGFIGRSMDRQAKLASFKLSRKAIATSSSEAVAMPLTPWDQFVEFCKAKVDAYNNRPHRSLPKIADPATGRRRHMTPNEAWERAVAAGFEPHLVTDDEARPLFRPQVLRTIQRCEINLFGNRYFSRQLEEFNTEQLRIGYDIHDPSTVWVYDATGRFLCTAELDGNRRDYMPMSVIERARDQRAAGRERRLQNKLVEVQLERRGAPALEMPQQITIPGLMSSFNVSQLADRARQAELVEVQSVQTPPLAATPSMPIEHPTTWTVPATAAERYAEWQRISNLNEEELEGEKQKKWRHTYQETAEFRAFQKRTA